MSFRDVNYSDLPALSQTLANAFAQDPFHGWAIATASARRRRSPRFYAAMMAREIGRGKVLMTDGGEATAIWHDSESSSGVLREVRFSLRMIEILRHRLPVVGIGTALTSRYHPNTPHWFLVVLGVDVNHQRRGHGRTLMEPILQLCDADRKPAYLEASTTANVEYYRQFGFEVVRPYRLLFGPTIYPMIRSV